MNDPQAANDTNTSNSPGVSTSITSVNGKTEVKVNGQTVQPASDGSVSKTVTTDDGTVNVNVSQDSSNTGSGSGSSFTMYNSSSSSSANGYNFNSEQSVSTGN